MLKIFVIIFCSLVIAIFLAAKLNHVKTWKEKNYEKLILEFGEPKILSELKGRHIVKTDLNQGFTDRLIDWSESIRDFQTSVYPALVRC